MMHAQDSLEMGYDDVASSSVQQHQQQRTIQWRIALGILSSISSNTNNNTNNKAKQEKEEEDNWSHQLATQRAQYAQLVQQYPYPTTTTTDQEDDNDDGDDDDDGIVVAGAAADSKNNNKDDDDDFLDPLTAMYMQEKQQSDRLQQRELQYRKEKARRKRGFAVSSASSNNKDYEDESLTEQELQAVGLQIIDKDLARLPHPDSLHGTSVCCSFRKDILRQVLFLYQCTTTTAAATTTAAVSHNHCGYQQGMHEIASYVLYALELERETSSLSDQSIYADTYTMVQVILTQLLPAYDVEVAPAPTTTTTEEAGDDDDDDNNNRNASPRQQQQQQQTNHSKTIPTTTRTTTTTTTKHHHHHHNKPLEQMGQRILQQLAQHDPVLYQMWMSSSLASIPPQLIFTKWIRLLFSREVTNVLGLWDVLFGQMQQHGVSLQQVAETVAVARLLMHRTILLEKHYQHHQAHSTTTTTTTITRGSGGSSNSDLLHYLMNMPVEESIQPLIQLLPPMLRGESVAAFLPPAPTMTTAAAAAATPSSSSTTTRVGATLTQAFQSMKTTVNAQHHPLVSTTTPLFRTPENVVDAGGLSRFSLSNVTEKLASQTQSIGKRLQQEWEQLAQQHQQQQQRQLHHHLHHPLDNDQLRNYDDPPPRPTWDNNNDNNTQDDPYAAVIPPAAQGHAPQPQQFLLSPLADGGGGGGGGMTPSSPSRRLLGQFGISPNQQLAQQMQKPLSVLQHFAMQVQRDQRHVPDQVWEALASLEVVRTKLGQS